MEKQNAPCAHYVQLCLDSQDVVLQHTNVVLQLANVVLQLANVRMQRLERFLKRCLNNSLNLCERLWRKCHWNTTERGLAAESDLHCSSRDPALEEKLGRRVGLGRKWYNAFQSENLKDKSDQKIDWLYSSRIFVDQKLSFLARCLGARIFPVSVRFCD